MTVGSIVEHWAHGRGIILEIESDTKFIKVHWDQPVYWPDDESNHVVWSCPEDITVISEVK